MEHPTINLRWGTSRDRKVLERSLQAVTDSLSQFRKLKDCDILNLASVFFESCDSPTSLGLYLCIRHGDIRSLLTHSIDPRSYTEQMVDLFSLDHQCVSLLSKYPFEVPLFDTRAAAIDAGLWAEASCSSSNDRLYNWADGRLVAPPGVDSAISLATDRIAWLLGRFDADEWESECRFGPGVSCNDSSTVFYDKLHRDVGVNPQAYPLILSHINASERWRQSFSGSEEGPFQKVKFLRLEDYGRRTYVPKNAKTDRPIEIQPGFSAYLQLGIGRMIRSRLKNVGVDLDHGWRKNAHLAYIGSKDGSLVTLDLKSASDTICRQLVLQLLPSDWLHAMTMVRPRFLLDNERLVETERFSSMGNGYTFELESMIFYALVWACRRLSGDSSSFAIFGDDIAVGASSVPLIEETFRFCGLTFNEKKSFRHGLFRESCGADWFLGVDVSPLRITREVENAQDLVELCNRIRRYAIIPGSSCYLDSRYRQLWIRSIRHLPPAVRSHLSGPTVLGNDSWLHADTDSFMSNPIFKQWWSGGFDRRITRVMRLAQLCKSRPEKAITFGRGVHSFLYKVARHQDSGNPEEDRWRYGVSGAYLRGLKLGSGGEFKIPYHRPRIHVRAELAVLADLVPIQQLWV